MSQKLLFIAIEKLVFEMCYFQTVLSNEWYYTTYRITSCSFHSKTAKHRWLSTFSEHWQWPNWKL